MDKYICQIVDSSGGLPRGYMKQHGISEVPFYFKFNNPDYYRENVDCGMAEFYKHMEEYPDEIPKTSAPNIYDWLTVFERKYAEGAKKYIVTTISSKLSSSFQAANLAKSIFMKKNSDVQVKVVDSNTCACGQAALEISISKMIEQDILYQDIIQAIDKTVATINTLFVVNSLKYMESGGRIGGATAFVGKLVQIKPICEFVDGVVRPIKAVIGRRSSLKKMIDVAISRMIDLDKLIITIQNAGFQADTDYAISYLRKTANFTGPIYKSELGITVGAHSGPGAVGIGFVADSLA